LNLYFRKGVIVIINKNTKKANFTIIIKDNNIEKAIRKMKTKATKLGILKTYRDKQRYEKPSDIRIRKQRYEKPSDIRIRKAKEGKINLYKAKKKRENNL
jgi:ribosomal protein S21